MGFQRVEMQLPGTLKGRKSNSFQTHVVNDGVVFSTADLELISVAQRAAVVNQPAHQERLFPTDGVQVRDVRLWEPPDCNTTKRTANVAGMEPSVEISIKKRK